MKNQDMIVERTKQLLSGWCCDELKDAAQKFLDALGGDAEQAAAKAYVNVLEESVMKADDVIAFMGTDFAKEKFGAEKAAQIKSHTEEVKAAGGIYCDCPACRAGLAVLEYKADLLAD